MHAKQPELEVLYAEPGTIHLNNLLSNTEPTPNLDMLLAPAAGPTDEDLELAYAVNEMIDDCTCCGASTGYMCSSVRNRRRALANSLGERYYNDD